MLLKLQAVHRVPKAIGVTDTECGRTAKLNPDEACQLLTSGAILEACVQIETLAEIH